MNGYEMSEALSNPDHPNIVLSFAYHQFDMQIDESEHNGQRIYAVWANHADGCAVAVPCALTRSEAIQRAKRWVEKRRADLS